ncbi:hypothetical protein BN946_scf184894.g4 [Trametes cinnabarina]|uniref:Uncharacterized protein n=1 Tax=Pycnoporus cinnabarinus TaxID=5643 RepID=A0A060SPB0_PYCCI|nr:hypothetical protein BN946_scf184894.g4 [Trametes cinnabarina]
MVPGFPGLVRVTKGKKVLHRPAVLDSPSTSPSPALAPPPKKHKPAPVEQNPPKAKKSTNKRPAQEETNDPEDGSPEPSEEAHTSAKRARPDVPEHDHHVIRAYMALDHRAQLITRLANQYEHLYQAACLLPRSAGAYVDYEKVLSKGLAWYGTYSSEDPERKELVFGEYYEVRCYFKVIKHRFPGLSENIEYLRQDPDLVTQIAHFMHTVAGKACSDDAGRVRRYIYELADWSDPVLKEKTARGFKHTVTGRLLCPITHMDDFDEDPEKFCRLVRDNHEDRVWATGDDWPICMYKMDEHIPGNFQSGFLKSRLLLKCFKLIFAGPASVVPSLMTGTQKAKGKLPIINRFADPTTAISIYSIVYVACLTRYALNAQSEWYDDDGDFLGREFVTTILTIALRDLDWQKEVTAWYKRHVLKDPRGQAHPPNRRTAFSAIMGSTAPTSSPASPTPVPEDHDDQGEDEQEEPEENGPETA